jgi:glycosyltransferase
LVGDEGERLKISIVTPSLNTASVISHCIRSVARQGLPADHIVVDGGSSDGTLKLIEELGTGVRLLRDPASGIYPAINAGIRAATGDIVGVLHADDFYASKDVLPLVLKAFDDPMTGACYGDLCYVDRADPSRIVRYWRAGAFQSGRFRHGWMPPHPTFFVRRRIYESFGFYRDDLGTAADYELMVRFLVKHRVPAAYIPQVLVHMRTGGASNASIKARLEANRMDRKAWEVNDLRPCPWTTIAKPLRKVGQWWSRP